MHWVRTLVIIAALGAWTVPAFAVHPDEILSDAGLEHRARALSGGLRCLVCQNQSIDDSDAPLAHDLRVLVRERLKSGDSDAAVMDYVVKRYGDFVLLKPPFKASTLVLWLAPLMVLLAGIAFMLRARRGATTAVAERGLTQAEQERLDSLLGDGRGSKT